jgi:hypothetical protein
MNQTALLTLADDALASPSEVLTLMHGTTVAAHQRILASGKLNKRSYLTDCFDSASYYAREKGRRSNASRCILVIEVSPDQLTWDIDSFLDPIKPIRMKHRLTTKQDMIAWWDMVAKLEGQDHVSAAHSLEMVHAAISIDEIPEHCIKQIIYL